MLKSRLLPIWFFGGVSSDWQSSKTLSEKGEIYGMPRNSKFLSLFSFARGFKSEFGWLSFNWGKSLLFAYVEWLWFFVWAASIKFFCLWRFAWASLLKATSKSIYAQYWLPALRYIKPDFSWIGSGNVIGINIYYSCLDFDFCMSFFITFLYFLENSSCCSEKKKTKSIACLTNDWRISTP